MVDLNGHTHGRQITSNQDLDPEVKAAAKLAATRETATKQAQKDDRLAKSSVGRGTKSFGTGIAGTFTSQPDSSKAALSRHLFTNPMTVAELDEALAKESVDDQAPITLDEASANLKEVLRVQGDPTAARLAVREAIDRSGDFDGDSILNVETPTAKAHIRAQSLYSSTSYCSLEVPQGSVSANSPGIPNRYDLLVVVPDGLPEGLVDLQLNTVSPASPWAEMNRLAVGRSDPGAEANQRKLFVDETPNVHANNVWNPSVGMTDHTSHMSAKALRKVSIIGVGGVHVPAVGGHPGAMVYSVNASIKHSTEKGYRIDMKGGVLMGPEIDEQILHEQRKTELRAIDAHPEKYSRPALARGQRVTPQGPLTAMGKKAELAESHAKLMSVAKVKDDPEAAKAAYEAAYPKDTEPKTGIKGRGESAEAPVVGQKVVMNPEHIAALEENTGQEKDAGGFDR